MMCSLTWALDIDWNFDQLDSAEVRDDFKDLVFQNAYYIVLFIMHIIVTIIRQGNTGAVPYGEDDICECGVEWALHCGVYGQYERLYSRPQLL